MVDHKWKIGIESSLIALSDHIEKLEEKLEQLLKEYKHKDGTGHIATGVVFGNISKDENKQ